MQIDTRESWNNPFASRIRKIKRNLIKILPSIVKQTNRLRPNLTLQNWHRAIFNVLSLVPAYNRA